MAYAGSDDGKVQYCYVAPGRRYTTENSSGSIFVWTEGDLVCIPNDAVERLVADGHVLAPGVAYTQPAGFPNGEPPVGRSGASKIAPMPPAAQTRNYGVTPPSAPSKTVTLPSAPTDPSSLVIYLNGVAYLGPAISNVSGASVTLTMTVQPTDVIAASYK